MTNANLPKSESPRFKTPSDNGVLNETLDRAVEFRRCGFPLKRCLTALPSFALCLVLAVAFLIGTSRTSEAQLLNLEVEWMNNSYIMNQGTQIVSFHSFERPTGNRFRYGRISWRNRGNNSRTIKIKEPNNTYTISTSNASNYVNFDPMKGDEYRENRTTYGNWYFSSTFFLADRNNAASDGHGDCNTSGRYCLFFAFEPKASEINKLTNGATVEIEIEATVTSGNATPQTGTEDTKIIITSPSVNPDWDGNSAAELVFTAEPSGTPTAVLRITHRPAASYWGIGSLREITTRPDGSTYVRNASNDEATAQEVSGLFSSHVNVRKYGNFRSGTFFFSQNTDTVKVKPTANFWATLSPGEEVRVELTFTIKGGTIPGPVEPRGTLIYVVKKPKVRVGFASLTNANPGSFTPSAEHDLRVVFGSSAANFDYEVKVELFCGNLAFERHSSNTETTPSDESGYQKLTIRHGAAGTDDTTKYNISGNGTLRLTILPTGSVVPQSGSNTHTESFGTPACPVVGIDFSANQDPTVRSGDLIEFQFSAQGVGSQPIKYSVTPSDTSKVTVAYSENEVQVTNGVAIVMLQLFGSGVGANESVTVTVQLLSSDFYTLPSEAANQKLVFTVVQRRPILGFGNPTSGNTSATVPVSWDYGVNTLNYYAKVERYCGNVDSVLFRHATVVNNVYSYYDSGSGTNLMNFEGTIPFTGSGIVKLTLIDRPNYYVDPDRKSTILRIDPTNWDCAEARIESVAAGPLGSGVTEGHFFEFGVYLTGNHSDTGDHYVGFNAVSSDTKVTVQNASGNVHIPLGRSSGTGRVMISGDVTSSDDVKITVTLGRSDLGTFYSTDQSTNSIVVQVKDNDSAAFSESNPRVSISHPDPDTVEAGGLGTVTVSADSGNASSLSEALTVNLKATATEVGFDVADNFVHPGESVAFSVRIDAATKSRTFDVAAGEYASGGSLKIELLEGHGYVVNNDATSESSITLTVTESVPTLSVKASGNGQVAEGHALTFTIEISETISTAFNVTWAIENDHGGTAVREDFVNPAASGSYLSGTVSFAANEKRKYLSVAIARDPTPQANMAPTLEPDETFFVTLSNPQTTSNQPFTGVRIPPGTGARAIILADADFDQGDNIELEISSNAEPDGVELGDPITLTVTATPPPSTPLVIQLALNVVDENSADVTSALISGTTPSLKSFTGGTLTIPANSDSVSIQVNTRRIVTSDNHTFTATLLDAHLRDRLDDVDEPYQTADPRPDPLPDPLQAGDFNEQANVQLPLKKSTETIVLTVPAPSLPRVSVFAPLNDVVAGMTARFVILANTGKYNYLDSVPVRYQLSDSDDGNFIEEFERLPGRDGTAINSTVMLSGNVTNLNGDFVTILEIETRDRRPVEDDPNGTITVTLLDGDGYTVADNQDGIATATITDDVGIVNIVRRNTNTMFNDHAIGIDEGDSGTTSFFFDARISKMPAKTVRVDWQVYRQLVALPDDLDTRDYSNYSREQDKEYGCVFGEEMISKWHSYPYYRYFDVCPRGSINWLIPGTNQRHSAHENVGIRWLNGAHGKFYGEDFVPANYGERIDASDFKDGQLPSGTVEFTANVLPKPQAIEVEVAGDTLTEPNEVFFVILSNLRYVESTTETPVDDGAVVIGNNMAAHRILNDDGPNLSVAPISPGIFEGDGGVTNYPFRVTLSEAVDRPFNVWWKVEGSGGSAAGVEDFYVERIVSTNPQTNEPVYGRDMKFPTGRVRFERTENNGTMTATTATLLVPINGDGDSEANEEFTVTLVSPSGGIVKLAANPTATGMILDDETQNYPVLSIANASPVTEGTDSTASFVVTATGANPGASQMVSYTATNEVGNFLASGSGVTQTVPLSFSAAGGVHTATLTLAISGNSNVDGTGRISVQLEGSNSYHVASAPGSSTASVLVYDNDSVQLSIGAPSQGTVTEGDPTGDEDRATQEIMFPLSASRSYNGTVYVNYTVEDCVPGLSDCQPGEGENVATERGNFVEERPRHVIDGIYVHPVWLNGYHTKQVTFANGQAMLPIQYVVDTEFDYNGKVRVTLVEPPANQRFFIHKGRYDGGIDIKNPEPDELPVLYPYTLPLGSAGRFAEVSMVDDDGLVLALEDKVVPEGDGDGSVTVQVRLINSLGGPENAPAGGIEFTWRTVALTATESEDFVGVMAPETYTAGAIGTGSIAAGMPHTDLTVMLKGDTFNENNETFRVELVQITTGTNVVLQGSYAIVTIQEDDILVSLTSTETSVNEGFQFSVTVRVKPAPAANNTFRITTLSVSSGSDIFPAVLTAGTATNPLVIDSSGEGEVAVTTRADRLYTRGGEITVTLRPSPQYKRDDANISVTVDVIDREGVPELSFDRPHDRNYESFFEGDQGVGRLPLRIKLSHGSIFDISFTASTKEILSSEGLDTATVGSDYTALTNKRFTIPARQTSFMENSVAINGDTEEEDDEAFRLELVIDPQSDAVFVGDDTTIETIVYILDNERMVTPTIEFSNLNDGSINEGEVATFVITATPPPRFGSLRIGVQTTVEGDFLVFRVPRLQYFELDRVSLDQSKTEIEVPTRINYDNTENGSITIRLMDGPGYDLAEDQKEQRVMIMNILGPEDIRGTDFAVAGAVLRSILRANNATSRGSDATADRSIARQVSITTSTLFLEEGSSAQFEIRSPVTGTTDLIIQIDLTGSVHKVSGEHSRTAVLAAGRSATTLTVETTDDGVAGPDESMTATIRNAPGVIEAVPNSATVTITDTVDRQARFARMNGANREVLTNVMANVGAGSLSATSGRIATAFSGNGKSTYEFGDLDSFKGLVKTVGESANGAVPDLRALIGDSSVTINLFPEEGVDAPATVWAVGDHDLQSGSGGQSWNSEYASGYVGFDMRFDSSLLIGLAASNYFVDVLYGGNADEMLTYDISSTGLHPYVGFASDDRRTSLRATAGYGRSEIAIGQVGHDTDHLNGVFNTAAVSGTQQLYTDDGFLGGKNELTLEGYSWYSQQTVVSASGHIAELRPDARHVSISAVGSHFHQIPIGTIEPSVSIGLRRDVKNLDSTQGLEIGNGLEFQDDNGMSVSSVSEVFIGSGNEIRSWKLAGELAFDRGSDQLGILLNFKPSWVQVRSIGSDAIWSRGIAGPNAQTGAIAEGRGIVSELGYGLTIFDEMGILTPYGGVNYGEPGTSEMRLGGRFDAGTTVDLELEGTRFNRPKGYSEQTIGISGLISW